MRNDASPDILLGYTLNLESLGRRQLAKILGGGATAVVFLGVAPEAPDDANQHVAVKVARPEAQWRQALETEWQNLMKLAEAEKTKGTHYFPRVLWPDSRERMQVELYVRHPTQGWGSFTWAIMIQELVRGQGVHDLLLNYPELRLPEPLALAIGLQYVEMLTILHGADLTCADRKLADLRWQEAYALRPDDRTALSRWRNGEASGQLMVLDWNVTDRADQDHIALDLFRFGVLWHRLLLGTEPRFQHGSWQLEEPLNRHPAWSSLSTGTQQILSRLFHPQPENRYRTATSLLEDLRKQIVLWQTSPHDLWDTARSEVKAIEERWTAIDLLRVLMEAWDASREDFSDFSRVYNSIRRAREEAPFRPLWSALDRSDWRTTQEEVNRLAKAFATDPTRRLQIDRYQQIITANQRGDTPFPDLLRLRGYLDRLSELKEEELATLEGWKNRWHGTEWGNVLERLWAEAGYHQALPAARALSLSGKIVEAEKRFRDVLRYREVLKQQEQGESVVAWLDELYKDPTEEAQTIAKQAEKIGQIADLLRAGLQAVADQTDLAEAKKRLDEALRAAPGEMVLGRAHYLLLAEEAWRQAANSSLLTAQILRLGQWQRAWSALRETPATDRLGPENWAKIEEDLTPALDELFSDRLETLRTEMIRLARCLAPAASGNSPETAPPPDESLRQLVALYREAFPDHTDGGKLNEDLKRIIADCQDKIRERLASLSQTPRQLRQLEEHYRQQQEALAWAFYGQRLAEIVGTEWPSEFAPQTMAEKTKEAYGCLVAAWTALGRYLGAA